MKRLLLTSHYNKHQMTLHISDENAKRLQRSEHIMEQINSDIDIMIEGYQPRYLSKGQCKRINDFFGSGNFDYFDAATIY